MRIPWERRHPCLLASGNSRLTEAGRQGCLRSQGFSEEAMIRSLFVGITEANRSWKMILLLLAANILLSLPAAALIFLLMVGASSGTLAADRLMGDKLDVFWVIDLFNHQFPGAALETVALQAEGGLV